MEKQEEEMRRKIEDLERELEHREIPKPTPVVKARAVQTDEDPLAGEVSQQILSVGSGLGMEAYSSVCCSCLHIRLI